MLLSYARCSTGAQDQALQLDAMRQAGCDKLFVETASGLRTNRPEPAKLLDASRVGDTSWSGASTGWRAAPST